MSKKLEKLLLAKVKEQGGILKQSCDMINDIISTTGETIDLPSFAFFLAAVENACTDTLDKIGEEFPKMVVDSRAAVRGELFPEQEMIEALLKRR